MYAALRSLEVRACCRAAQVAITHAADQHVNHPAVP
jgi:hypothetical protein